MTALPRPAARSRWLLAARMAWLGFFTLATLSFLVAVPARWVQLTQPTPITQANLAALGWPVGPHAVFTLGSEVVFTAVFLLVSLIIFARRADDRMAWFASLMLVAFGVGNQSITLTLSALQVNALGDLLFAFFAFAAWASFTQFPYLFPSGRYVPHWTRLPALIWFLLCIPWNFMSGSPLDPLTWPLAVFGPLLLALYGSFAVAQVYRFARVSTRLERQQTKWVMYMLAVVVAAYFGLVGLIAAGVNAQIVPYIAAIHSEPPTPELYAAVSWLRVAFMLTYLLLPVGMTFSILRYRLWDIDLLIRRTLIYSLLTLILGLTYFGGVLGLQGIFQAVTGESRSALVTVLSTLTIAALFGPLRGRVQRAIDRRFYRQKYDAARTLAAFGAQARDVVELEQLSEQLVAAVDETMQPAHVGLWVKPVSKAKS